MLTYNFLAKVLTLPNTSRLLLHVYAWHAFITFRVSRRRREMYCGHARLFVCLSVRGRILTLYTIARTRM